MANASNLRDGYPTHRQEVLKTLHPERNVLDVLVSRWPAAVPVDQIAAETGYSATSGGFRNALSRLRSLQLASGRGELVINDALMDETVVR